jgi:glycosyltransferase involved in cell wall biosynthesis
LLIDARMLRQGATGVGTYTAQLLRAMDALAPAMGVRLLALRLAGTEHPIWSQLAHTVVQETGVDYESHPGGDWFLHVGLPRLARRLGADTVLSPAFVAPVLAPRGGAGLRRVVIVHDLFVEDPAVIMPPLFRCYLRSVVQLALRRCELVVTPSAVTRRALIARRGGPVLFVPPAVDHALFRPQRRGPRLPDGSVRERPVLLYTASFDPHKNHALLFAARPEQSCTLVLLHSGVWTGAPLPPWVRVVAPRDAADVAAWTAAADVAVFPSRAEGFGIPMLEAMATGTPLVAADSPASRWLSGGGRAALLLPADNPAAWSHALTGVLSDHDPTLTSRVTAGLRRAAGFTWTRSAQRLLAALYGPADAAATTPAMGAVGP